MDQEFVKEYEKMERQKHVIKSKSFYTNVDEL